MSWLSLAASVCLDSGVLGILRGSGSEGSSLLSVGSRSSKVLS